MKGSAFRHRQCLLNAVTTGYVASLISLGVLIQLPFNPNLLFVGLIPDKGKI